ncbi:phosphoribosyltransferase [Pseudoxanthomonas spadix]|uniref:phosphoribosyltransferase n=1 Tax=Pseudoxanthomonas spadix TaxID=415229 RepID=UPI000EFFE674|nr:phosphoribosyltransferase [Pseudoxanthomonas spadix]MBP3973649.1 phosphoribosyltransferase [Pseudoxanthomonas spadix]RMW98140.1 phosphoribosyltransferase [Pseudoxanthomonas spadix]
MESHFEDRHAAGRLLAGALRAYAGRSDLVVLALARGGVPVGYEVAKALGAEFDVLIVRKLGLPHHPELAMGAIASGGAIDLNRNVIAMSGVTQRDIEGVLAQEYRELTRREALYRGARPAARIEGRTVIVVDDGIATGASMRAALKALRTRKPAKIIVAVPVAPIDTRERLQDVADEFVCVLSPADFQAVGQFYRNFDQTSDDEVRTLLAKFDSTGALK